MAGFKCVPGGFQVGSLWVLGRSLMDSWLVSGGFQVGSWRVSGGFQDDSNWVQGWFWMFCRHYLVDSWWVLGVL